jgi:hypothetical protein
MITLNEGPAFTLALTRICLSKVNVSRIDEEVEHNLCCEAIVLDVFSERHTPVNYIWLSLQRESYTRQA